MHYLRGVQTGGVVSRGGTDTQWRRARALAFQVYGDACILCGDRATEVDHIIEVVDGGTDDIENLQPLCSSCHKQKTASFNSKRMTKNKNPEINGFFLRGLPPLTPVSVVSLPKPTIIPPMAPKKIKESQ